MIYADGMHGRFRLGYGAQFIHVAAAIAEDRAEIDDLVACDADPNTRDAGGCTPLHYAAWNNPVGEVSAALFEAGADPEAARLCHQRCQRRLHRGGAGRGRRSCRQRRCREDARGTARYACPAFGKTRAYRRLMRAGFAGGFRAGS